MTGLIPFVKNSFNKHGSTILAVCASIGVGGTAYLAAKATPKAIEKIHVDSKKKHGDDKSYTKMEAIKSAAPCYIPTILTGTATVACIFGIDILGKRSQAAAMSLYGLVSSSYREYQDKLKELYGEEVHNNVMDAIIKEHCEDVHISGECLCSNSSLDWQTSEPEIVRTFYDTFSKRYFESTVSRVLQAEYHFNRNYVLGGAVCINEFYDFLGLSHIEGGEDIGFDVCESELYWVDFNHRVTTIDDGMEVLVIEYGWYPTPFGEDND